MSNNDAEQRCMICRAIGFVIAAIVVGLITWALFKAVPAWLAIILFLALFALGLWLVMKFCGEPEATSGAHASSGSQATAAPAAAAAQTTASADASAEAKAKADADAAAKAEADAAAKAEADAAAKAEADAAAKAEADAAAKAEADAAAKAEADAAARAEAEAAQKARETAQAEADAAAKAEADAAAKAEEAAKAEAAAAANAQADAAAPEPAPADTARADEAAAIAAATAMAEQDAASGSAEAAGEDYDGDGLREGTDEGTKPATLAGPRDGGPDNLKEIKGVGPKMEKMLHGMGFFHFDQVAAWTDDEVAWVDANLEGFKGRVSRDAWVAQAKILAAGGETEFSKRVDEGDVY